MGFLDFLKEKQKPGKIKDLPPEVEEVVKELRNVKDPETELNIVDEGLLYGLTVENEKVMVWLLFAKTTPECHFCQAIAMNVQRKIVGDIIEVLKKKGFRSIEVYNEIGLLLEAWKDETG
ncbi:MAG: Uncharacterized protein XD43_1377 [Thermococcales archaeon 44_46]|jgi:metal-sulfur cluster biosynthetic enzyme|uniref:iron-sulfur cluster assembly protein n=1 Tax=Thermococcus TaxID=2263 RepID=UPI0005B2D5E0|nr:MULTISPECIES: iron-sulfur cluster assembly protein [Thermococcus]KUJ98959.1 MAG: Uncharacterized protein XD43_1377 [Thermococcales archaeon 44_46]MCA6212764.1 DUF59 domain-containing protein [Thermococcus bergensis]HIH73566.1 iron-sulfur cluster assembly protein [Thermococcaceae archaeon]